MNLSYPRISVALLALAAASPAAAEITAPELWAQWQQMTAGMGAEAPQLSAEAESYADGVLTLDGVGFTMDLPEGKAKGRMDKVVLTEQGDGTVAIDYLGEYVIDADLVTPEAGTLAIQFALAVSGMDMVASRTGDATTYEYGIETMTGELRSAVADGKDVPGTAEVSVTGIAGSYTLTEGDPMTVDSASTSDALSVLIDFADPKNAGNSVNVTAEYLGLDTSSAGTLTGMFAMGDPQAMLSGDVRMEGGYSHTGGSYTIRGASVQDGAFSMTASSDAGAIDYAFNGDTVDVSLANSGVAMAVSGDAIPMPELTASAEEIRTRFAMPLTRSDEMQDFGLLVNLGGLGVSEMLWSMIDPAGALPHDPATLLVDLGGRLRLTADLTDEAAMNSPVPPFDFEVLTLKDLRLDLAGAELTGAGGLDFSGAPEGAMPGMPGVTGDVTLQLEGGNGLLEKLVAMGLIPQDQAMGFQMMLGMFAKPVGDDTVQSEIVFGPDGSITANGTQLK